MGDAADETLSAFDEFFERALSLDVLTEAEVDALTDAVASGALSEEGVSSGTARRWKMRCTRERSASSSTSTTSRLRRAPSAS